MSSGVAGASSGVSGFFAIGQYREEEFDVAHQQFGSTGKPRIYTFFKNADIKSGAAREEDLTSLWAFKKKLDKLGHFYTSYDNIEHLKRQFRDAVACLSSREEGQARRMAKSIDRI